MCNLKSIISLLSFVLVCFQTLGHSGGLDDNGGHYSRQTATYHCHQPSCETSSDNSSEISIVSFNIQFLGHFKRRDNKALAAFLSPYDMVIIQELVSAPYEGQYPNDELYGSDKEAGEFFDEMLGQGFEYWLSEEDTGTNDVIHTRTTSTEWFVTFYRPEVVEPVKHIPHGYVAEDRSNHDDYERVPYASAYRTIEGGNDFVLVSVHLEQGGSRKDASRRKHELSSVANWIEARTSVETDYFIVGDMNFEDCDEISKALPDGFSALNQGSGCLATNTNLNGPKPYDNLLYHAGAKDSLATTELEVIDLIEAMRVSWYEDFSTPYPGDSPYNHDAFRQRYSDHHPVLFKVVVFSDTD
ncbi:hypothetical protein ACRRS0_05050 [Agarivorans sp. QJM3NY_29]|uniref:hypothetical protein n=1 Tax=unclassified Agarivorans TaxID=2636026 RepID=UPI003D7D25EA